MTSLLRDIINRCLLIIVPCVHYLCPGIITFCIWLLIPFKLFPTCTGCTFVDAAQPCKIRMNKVHATHPSLLCRYIYSSIVQLPRPCRSPLCPSSVRVLYNRSAYWRMFPLLHSIATWVRNSIALLKMSHPMCLPLLITGTKVATSTSKGQCASNYAISAFTKRCCS